MAEQAGINLSGGVKRLVGFGMVPVCPGRVVILDEPTNDVDPLRRRLLWQQVRELGDLGIAVLLVTHNVLEAEKAVDRLAIIDNGRLLAEGTPSSMKAGDRGQLRLQVMLVPGGADPELPGFVKRSTRVGHNLMAVIDDVEASHAIGWAQDLVGTGVAESRPYLRCRARGSSWGSGCSYAVLAGWTVVAWTATAWIIGRRK